MAYLSGRHFLQIPGPTNIPEQVLRAISAPPIDHRGPAFSNLLSELLVSIKPIFGTTNPVVMYPSSGTGAWEAALVNTLSPHDKVLFYETGQFASAWRAVADRLGLDTELIPGDWRHGVDSTTLADRLRTDENHAIKAVCVVYNETSTAITSDIAGVRAALDSTGHPALLLVDAVSAIGCLEYQHDEWGVDVTIAGSQKGLMLPSGLGFNAISDKALVANKSAKLARSYWDWQVMVKANEQDTIPYTPATNLLYGLRESLKMLAEEGHSQVFARHKRLAAATRAAVRGWGLELVGVNEDEHSSALTAIMLPDGHDADELRQLILERFNMSLGGGLGKLQGTVFRIGHLGYFNELMLAGTLAGVQMGLNLTGVPIKPGGIEAALELLESSS